MNCVMKATERTNPVKLRTMLVKSMWDQVGNSLQLRSLKWTIFPPSGRSIFPEVSVGASNAESLDTITSGLTLNMQMHDELLMKTFSGKHFLLSDVRLMKWKVA